MGLGLRRGCNIKASQLKFEISFVLCFNSEKPHGPYITNGWTHHSNYPALSYNVIYADPLKRSCSKVGFLIIVRNGASLFKTASCYAGFLNLVIVPFTTFITSAWPQLHLIKLY